MEPRIAEILRDFKDLSAQSRTRMLDLLRAQGAPDEVLQPLVDLHAELRREHFARLQARAAIERAQRQAKRTARKLSKP